MLEQTLSLVASCGLQVEGQAMDESLINKSRDFALDFPVFSNNPYFLLTVLFLVVFFSPKYSIAL